jgi:3D (Asp-Asp-Asp) domain-containing protein
MTRLRRFVRRNRTKLFIYVALLSLANFLVPQPASAKPLPVDAFEPAIAVTAEQPPPKPSLAEDRPLLPTPANLPVQRTARVMATAYTSSVDETDGDPWTTASGTRAGDGVIAANGLPFGTKVRLPDQYGDKIFIVLDRMSPRYGNRYIDIWMPTKQQAKLWGVNYLRMEVL